MQNDNVEFGEESIMVVAPITEGERVSGISGFLIRRGLVKNIERVNYLLVVIALLCLILTTLISWKVLFHRQVYNDLTKEQELEITPAPFNQE